MMKRNIFSLVSFILLLLASNIQILLANELLFLNEIYGIEIVYLNPFLFSISNYEYSISLLNLGTIFGALGIIFSVVWIIQDKKK